MRDNWSKEDYAEFNRQVALINKSYAMGIPQERVERIAAEIVDAQTEKRSLI